MITDEYLDRIIAIEFYNDEVDVVALAKELKKARYVLAKVRNEVDEVVAAYEEQYDKLNGE